MASRSIENPLPKGIRARGKRSFQIRYKNAGGKLQEETIAGATRDEALEEARRILAIRQGDIARGIPTTSKPHTVTFLELTADVVNHYEANGLSSKADIEGRYRLHLLPFFGEIKRAAEITTADFERYKIQRKKEGATVGTICRELEAAKRAFLLARNASPPKIHLAPHIPMPRETNIRQGFFEPDRLEAICRHLPAHLIPVARFGYHTGWRHGEVLGLTLGHVDLAAGEIRLESGETKNGKGRTFPITVELRALLISIWPAGSVFPNTPLFRDPDGAPIQSFYKAWATACRLAGLPVRWIEKRRAILVRNDDGSPRRDSEGRRIYERDAKDQLILEPVLYKRGPKKGQPQMVCRAAVHFHDFRRTVYRNLVRLGSPPAVARAAVGWLDAKTAERYDIVAKADLDVLREKIDQAHRMVKNAKSVVNFADESE